MKYFNVLLILSMLFVMGCSSNLQQAGQDHALVFEKWQALSEYAGDTFVDEQIQIVGKLIVEPNDSGNKFILTDFRLTHNENPYQINLRNPQFQNKYICNGPCVQLTEYLILDNQDATMLTRYFSQSEFKLFELYGDIFTLKSQISQMKLISEQHYEHYLNWLISDMSSFDDIDTFRDFLKQSFTRDAFIKFIQTPTARYSKYISNNGDSNDGISSDDFTNAPNTNWIKNAVPQETEVWMSTIQGRLLDFDAKYLAFTEKVDSDVSQQSNISISVGDMVCERQGNEFGHVSAIMGTELTVSMLGRAVIIQDGIFTSVTQTNVFSGKEQTIYRPNEGSKVYSIEQIGACEFGQSSTT
jgi:hypothetical protein